MKNMEQLFIHWYSKKSKKYFNTYISTLTYLFQITFSVQNGVKFKNALASTCLFGGF